MGQSLNVRRGRSTNQTATYPVMAWIQRLSLLLAVAGVFGQSDEELTQEQKLCRGKSSGELFRLKAGDDSCRDVIQCTAGGLQAIRCPPGLAFDLEKQTCDWKWAVKNCDKLTKERKVQPLLSTDEPLCENNKLACGDSICISKDLFCDGKKDCTDGSDENACDIDNDPNRAPPCDKEICKLPDCFSSEEGETPMDVTLRPPSSSPTSTQTTLQFRTCTGWVTRSLLIPSLTTMTRASGQMPMLRTGQE